MPKYLLQASYTPEGSKRVLNDGGARQREVVERLVKAVGGKVEAFYFGFGEFDAVAIVDAPDNGALAAHSLALSAGGEVALKTAVLITPEEMDAAARKLVSATRHGAHAVSTPAADAVATALGGQR